jgi:hypothetical protein
MSSPTTGILELPGLFLVSIALVITFAYNLGITGRLAQGQGLDHEPPLKLSLEQKNVRNLVWYAKRHRFLSLLTPDRQRVMWQDCLLSMTYDRASCIVEHKSDRTKPSEELSYGDAMFEMCSVGLELLKFRAPCHTLKPDHHLRKLMHYQDRINQICERTVLYLRDNSKGVSMRQHLEYYNLLMHKSYFLSEVGRPTLKLGTAYPHKFEAMVTELKTTCVNSLRGTVEAFLGLQNVSKFACHSWAAVHRALSSALLLAIIGRQNEDKDVKRLLINLVTVMSATISDVDPSVLVTPITRAVESLRQMIPFEVVPSGDVASERMEAFAIREEMMRMVPPVRPQEFIQSSVGDNVSPTGAGGNPYSMVESILLPNSGSMAP